MTAYAQEDKGALDTEVCKRRGEYVVFTTCGCGPCCDRRHKTQKLQRTGRLPRVPAEEAWKVLDALIARGMGRRAICSVFPDVPGVADALDLFRATGHRQKFGRVYAARILRAGVDARPTLGLVNATGTTRRLRALACLGYDLAVLEARTGIDRNRLAYVRRGQRRTQVAVVEAVKTAYDELSMVLGGSQVARGHAERHGWFPPLAWDDEALDDPLARPHAAPRVKGANGRPPRWTEDMWAEVEWLRSFGTKDDLIADRMGIDAASLRKAERRRNAKTPAA